MSDLTLSEPQSHIDHFDRLPDSILLLIFNRIGDVKALGRCCVVSCRRSTPPLGRFLQTSRLCSPLPPYAHNPALPGHAVAVAAAKFLLALSHDYVLIRRDRGMLYMRKVDIGLTALMRSKIDSASAGHDILLAARNVKGEEAVRMVRSSFS